MTRRRLELGAVGEERAAQWYIQRRYEVLARNWRCRDGELDIVLVAPDGTIVFSEVKTRSSSRFGQPVDAVTWDKQRRIRRLAAQFLRDEMTATAARRVRRRRARTGRDGGGSAVRFDVVSVRGDNIEVREGAF